MKVLWFSNTPGLGGEYLNLSTKGGGWIIALQKALAQSKEVDLGYVFYSENTSTPFEHKGTTYLPIQRKANSKLKRLAWKFMEKVEYDENLSSFLQAIEQFRPDMIHIHGSENPFGLIIPHVPNIPVAISIQGNLTVYADKFFSGLPRPRGLAALKPKNYLLMKQFKAFYNKAKIEQEMLASSRYVLGRTDWDRRICKVLAPKAAYFHSDEVIRPEFYTKKWHALPKSSKTSYLTTSSNSHYKGFETIIDTAIKLKGLGHNFEWAIAGLNISQDLVQRSMKSRKIHNLQELNIRLLGHLSVEGIIDRMLRTNVYVQVSHIENSPNSLCEAMLIGLPIVASYVGGTTTMIKEGAGALPVQSGDAFALAGALLELDQDPDKAREIAEQAYRIAHKRHDPKKIAADLLDTYQTIIADHRQSKVSTVIPQHSL